MTRRDETHGGHAMIGTSLALALVALGAGCGPRAGGQAQRAFATPEEAVAALAEACREDDSEAIVAIFGEEHRDYFASDDPSADRQARAAYAAAAEEKLSLVPLDGGGLELVVGEDEWPAPFPLVEEDGRWRFDTAAGIEESIARRVGRNELDAMKLLRGILDAQYTYANRDWDGDGKREFARRVLASEGAYDGLYWPPDLENGVPFSPLEGFVEGERDYAEGRETGDPWRGYRVKVLTEQGPGAPGGARSYLDGEDLTGGFAVVAAPAQYGLSGIMTFMVSQEGTIWQADLGEDSLDRAAGMAAFDLDDSWTKAD